jgi:diguanylate cyclase
MKDIFWGINILNTLLLIIIILYYIVKYKRLNRRFKVLLESDKKHEVFEIDLIKKKFYSSSNFYLFFDELLDVKYMSVYKLYSKLGLNFRTHYNMIVESVDNNTNSYEIDYSFNIDGQRKWVREYGKLLDNAKISGVILDITDKMLEREKLQYEVQRDKLTGLYNRYRYREKIQELINVNKDKLGVFIFIDLDKFKEVNDTYGHAVGDILLRKFGELLAKLNDDNTVIFRIAGDEFGLFKNGFDNKEDIYEYINKFTENFDKFIQIGNIDLELKYSCGVSIYNIHCSEIEKLIEYADFAMYQSKDNSSKTVSVFDEKEYESCKNMKYKIGQVPIVIKENQLYPVYQPIFNIQDNTIYGYEGLSRVTNVAFNNILELIQIAKDHNKNSELNQLMIDNILKDFRYDDKKLFINLEMSNPEISYKNFEKYLIEIKNMGIKLENLIVEIPERTDTKNNFVLEIIDILRKYNIPVALDDYGAGYSNEYILVKVHPEIIKLDKSVISGIDIDEYKQKFVRQFVAFAKQTNTKIVAEGIETKGELDKLVELGIDYGQGYYLGKPFKLHAYA